MVAASVGWWLFGWETSEHPSFGLTTAKRWFGRYTVLQHDSDHSGKPDSEVIWPWTEPLNHAEGPCGDASWLRSREDRNLDDTWDMWISRPDRSDPCRILLSADMNGDGTADYEIETTFQDLWNAKNKIDRNRGFPIKLLPWEEETDGSGTSRKRQVGPDS